MDVTAFIIAYAVAATLTIFVMVISIAKLWSRIDLIFDTIHEERNDRDSKFKGVGDAIAKFNNNLNDSIRHHHTVRTNDSASVDERFDKISSELTWLKMELSNLGKDLKELANEIHGDTVVDDIVETEDGTNYFYNKGIEGKVAQALDRIAKLNDKVETYYTANNNYHTSIGKQVSSLKAKIK